MSLDILPEWDELPEAMRNGQVRRYYDMLSAKRTELRVKRAFDIALAFSLLVALSPALLALGAAIKLDSKGPVFYRQTRFTTAMRPFGIHKFRSMSVGADKGLHLTSGNDPRVTRTGRFIRRYKLDELAQLADVLAGDMSFVGTRPEVGEYVERYTPEMLATLLLPAGITSSASVCYKDEARLLQEAEDTQAVYLEKILPDKMRYNLRDIEDFSLANDLKIMLRTALAVFTDRS